MGVQKLPGGFERDAGDPWWRIRCVPFPERFPAQVVRRGRGELTVDVRQQARGALTHRAVVVARPGGEPATAAGRGPGASPRRVEVHQRDAKVRCRVLEPGRVYETPTRPRARTVPGSEAHGGCGYC